MRHFTRTNHVLFFCWICFVTNLVLPQPSLTALRLQLFICIELLKKYSVSKMAISSKVDVLLGYNKKHIHPQQLQHAINCCMLYVNCMIFISTQLIC